MAENFKNGVQNLVLQVSATSKTDSLIKGMEAAFKKIEKEQPEIIPQLNTKTINSQLKELNRLISSKQLKNIDLGGEFEKLPARLLEAQGDAEKFEKTLDRMVKRLQDLSSLPASILNNDNLNALNKTQQRSIINDFNKQIKRANQDRDSAITGYQKAIEKASKVDV